MPKFTLQECIERANAMAEGRPLPPKTPINIINNKKSYRSQDLANLPALDGVNNSCSAGKINNINSRKSFENDYRGLSKYVNSNALCLKAQQWGMDPAGLYHLCRKYGKVHVTKTIAEIAAIGDGFFRLPNTPVNIQRGKYCRKVIVNNGDKLLSQKQAAAQ